MEFIIETLEFIPKPWSLSLKPLIFPFNLEVYHLKRIISFVGKIKFWIFELWIIKRLTLTKMKAAKVFMLKGNDGSLEFYD